MLAGGLDSGMDEGGFTCGMAPLLIEADVQEARGDRTAHHVRRAAPVQTASEDEANWRVASGFKLPPGTAESALSAGSSVRWTDSSGNSRDRQPPRPAGPRIRYLSTSSRSDSQRSTTAPRP